MLPQEFLERMKTMLGEEYPAFVESYDQPRFQALRYNPLKLGREEFVSRIPFALRPVPWSRYGYYYDSDAQPGRHPYHEAGMYYIQEPSAMAVVEYLDPRPGERILDLCASPGGKTTQIGGYMQGEGLLICNEIHPARAKILSENVERMGLTNALVTNETPGRLAEHFPEFFHRILVDAPCSGEGMFRKNEEAGKEWSPENVDMCRIRQQEILEEAAKMLLPGGRLVYSTCTFAPLENEGSIGEFLTRHPEFFVLPVEKMPGMAPGRKEWCEYPVQGIEHTIRLWPHRLEGEGHYLAVLQKEGTLPPAASYPYRSGQKPAKNKDIQEFLQFQSAFLNRKEREENLFYFGEQLYRMPPQMPSLTGLKVLRPGLHLGTLKKNRFEPSHALALSLKPEEARYTLNLAADSPELKGYLTGQSFAASGEKGWTLILADGLGIGWGKFSGGTMKNHYPRGLRKYACKNAAAGT